MICRSLNFNCLATSSCSQKRPVMPFSAYNKQLAFPSQWVRQRQGEGVQVGGGVDKGVSSMVEMKIGT